MRVGSKTVGVASRVRDLSTLGPFQDVLVDAWAAMRHIKFNGRLYHRSETVWEDPIQLTRSRPDVGLGPGFYTSTDSAPESFSRMYGPYLKILELPKEALKGKTAIFAKGRGWGDKQGASITVQPSTFYVVIHDTELIDAATVHPFFMPTEVFPTSPPAGG